MPLARAAVLAILVLAAPAPAGVVINEISYHPPDDLDGAQFVELHNPGPQPVDLGGWKLSRGPRFTFPAGTTLAAGGYLVVTKDATLFRKHYGADAFASYEGALADNGGRVDLTDAKGQRIDRVTYRSRAPWPLAADGYGPSLERICPTAPGESADNWAPSVGIAGRSKPGGTPGRQNSCFAPRLAPAVAGITVAPTHAAPGQELTVEANVKGAAQTVELRYRVAGPGSEGRESTVPMTKTPQGRYAARVPGQQAGQIVRLRVRVADAAGAERTVPHENELRPALSVYVHDRFAPGKVPFGLIVNVGSAESRAARQGFGWGNYGPPKPEPPARGNSAFVFVDQKTGVPELFDFVSVPPRGGGHKVRFHKDRLLGGMSNVNLIFEGVDRFVLAEYLAYEVYRKAGNAAPRSDFLRLWVDGRPAGYHLLVEQPNKAFLRHHKVRTDGDLYKCVWFGNGLIGQHEKKTREHEGHRGLEEIVKQLNGTRGDAQWEVIKANFDIEQVATYFAVNMVLSHWDGYFNNYFTYHDRYGSGKWTMYPWDQDKTWGFHDGIQGYDVFTDMPVTMGMKGDRPPGWPRGLPAPPGFGFGAVWWRPGGHFSQPLLANDRFRALFLAKTKEILETVYTEAVFFPVIDALGERLKEEVQVRGRLTGQGPEQAATHLRRNLDALKRHLTQRRQFLLAQDEIKRAPK